MRSPRGAAETEITVWYRFALLATAESLDVGRQEKIERHDDLHRRPLPSRFDRSVHRLQRAVGHQGGGRRDDGGQYAVDQAGARFRRQLVADDREALASALLPRGGDDAL